VRRSPTPLGLLLLACLAWPAPSAGEEAPGEEAPAPPAGEEEPEVDEEILITSSPAPGSRLPSARARSEVTREDLARRLPRSAPDALRFEPGVFVQQSAHGQGSAYLRGLTGQQTVLLFDGIRLNNSTYRQGPNQYFFTLDSQSLASIQVQRGGGSTRWGSDALGGVILALPVEPRPEASPGDWFGWDPHLRVASGTADGEIGGRLQTGLSFGDTFAFLGGAGGRHVGQLESGGAVHNPADGELPLVPRFADDGRTQLGTGFDELTFDGRLVANLSPRHRLKLALYGYRQFDAPRTDQCPAAHAPYDECLKYDEQFRTLLYAVYEGRRLGPVVDQLRATLSWQQQRERRTMARPRAAVQHTGRDVVDSLGLTALARSPRLALADALDLQLEAGLDTYHDLVSSAAWIAFTDIDVTARRSRGQYLEGSRYTYGGLYAQAGLEAFGQLRARAGARLSWIDARAPDDPESGTRAVERSWLPMVGNAGLEWRPLSSLAVLVNYDRSFRAPNLDDLTSRQQTGPGFQFENPALGPEQADTFELGLRLSAPILLEAWGFRTTLHDAVVKSPRQDADCPPDTPACQASWTKLQLVNAPADAALWGVEGSLLAELPWGLEARASVAWTWGEGPNVTPRPTDPDAAYQARVPLSRVPPLNGTVELVWRSAFGLTLGADVRWATRQDRLALSDLSDARIPRGGTPGFAVLDLRASARLAERLLVSVAMENVLDAAYRYHGSSVNGPGRSFIFLIDLGPLWRSPEPARPAGP